MLLLLGDVPLAFREVQLSGKAKLIGCFLRMPLKTLDPQLQCPLGDDPEGKSLSAVNTMFGFS